MVAGPFRRRHQCVHRQARGAVLCAASLALEGTHLLAPEIVV
jgi:hypothetical protein